MLWEVAANPEVSMFDCKFGQFVRCSTFLSAIVFSVAVPSGLEAQFNRATGAPQVLVISVEQRKPMMASAYDANGVAWADAYRAAGGKAGWYTLDAISGDGETWYLSGAGSFAELENQMKADQQLQLRDKLATYIGKASGQVSGVQEMYGRLVNDWSVNADDIDWGKVRYVQVLSYQLRPGHRGEFNQLIRKITGAYSKAPKETHYAVYEMAAGAPDVTVKIIIPMMSLAEMDADPEMQRAYFANIGGMDGINQLEKLAASSVDSGISQLFRVNPRTSVVSKEIANVDASFWNPKRASSTAK
jgi:hypothetical protein